METDSSDLRTCCERLNYWQCLLIIDYVERVADPTRPGQPLPLQTVLCELFFGLDLFVQSWADRGIKHVTLSQSVKIWENINHISL